MSHKNDYVSTQIATYFLLIMIISILLINFVTYSFFSDWGSGVLFALALFTLAVGLVITNFFFKEITRKTRLILGAITISFVFMAVMPQVFLGFGGFTGRAINHIRFQFDEEYYLNNLPASQGDDLRFVRFNWGGFMMNPIALVFDESDELAQPNKLKVGKWWDVVGRNSEFGVCNWDAQKVSTHFYVVTFSC